ncbi:MAG TPA: M48 family metallopeptidase [Noviherbaspirillum sp.]|nr:M48 family metallopeptidase [Noviherbaspirillum sp.]
MKYKPALPEQNDNVSHRKPVREFFLILAGLSIAALALFWVLGLAVDLAVDHMSAQAEARIHRALRVSYPQHKPHAPQMQARLERMVDELRACADLPYPVTLQLVKAEQPNAGVLPGAHILVFSGLLDKIETENALAFVLAHELAHLKNRDHLRGLGRTLLLLAISITLTGTHSDLTQILVPANQLGMARHSQARETAADNTALDILHCHYGHVGGATEFFEALHRRAGEAPVGLGHYFASHPELRARIDNLNRRAEQHAYPIGPTRALARQ